MILALIIITVWLIGLLVVWGLCAAAGQADERLERERRE